MKGIAAPRLSVERARAELDGVGSWKGGCEHRVLMAQRPTAVVAKCLARADSGGAAQKVGATQQGWYHRRQGRRFDEDRWRAAPASPKPITLYRAQPARRSRLRSREGSYSRFPASNCPKWRGGGGAEDHLSALARALPAMAIQWLTRARG
jgi:hypothetical protein